MSIEEKEIAREQEYVDMLYARLDAIRERAAQRRRGAAQTDGATPQSAVERDAFGSLHAARLGNLDAGADGLCFGRLDLTDGVTRYVGRVGLQDPAGPDSEPLLLDWRAPASRPFYVATAVHPQGVARRRRLHTYGRQVTGIADEVFDSAAAADLAGELVGEAALLSALAAARTGRMTDVVATIQAEQDEVIRADRHGVLVVAGGPGTGKTAVALHRAAYLLYAHRASLAKRAILVVGPSRTFCDYISDVLPGLGETDVLLATVDTLLPGVRAEEAEPREVAELKGRAGMAAVVASALAARQATPPGGVAVEYEGYELHLRTATCRRAADRARATGLPHNAARDAVAKVVLDGLTEAFADIIGADPLGGPNLLDASDVADIRRELASSAAYDEAVEALWPALTPQDLIAELYDDPEALAAAAPELTEAERALLFRRHPMADPLRSSGWTAADIPLLDEAAELLGDVLPDAAARARAREAEAERLEFAEGVLEIAHGSRSTDIEDIDPEAAEVLSVWDLLDAESLAERHVERDDRTPAERAAADRTWAFGHVVVDEAQELSAMAWRMVMRRCPTRSMTVVGDLVQASSPGAAASWAEVLAPFVPEERRRLVELRVNYRAPAEVMAVAAAALADVDPRAKVPTSVREAGVRPWRRRLAPAELAGELRAAVAGEVAVAGEGNVAVLAAPGRVAELRTALGVGGSDLRERVTVLAVGEAKGLEFDGVVVVEPAEIVAASPRGRSDLYVALTRSTHRLGVLHCDDLPSRLAACDAWAG